MPSAYDSTGAFKQSSTGTDTAKTENTVYAGPTAAPAAIPSFRSIVAADLPTIGTTKGGTNLTGYTTGDILYASATDVLSKLAKGTSGHILTQGASIPSWAAPAAPDLTSATGTLALARHGTQTANYVLAGPTSGGAAAPTFRALVSADLLATAGAVTTLSSQSQTGLATSLTYTLPANTLGTAGDIVEIEAFGKGGSGSADTVRVSIGGQNLVSKSIGANVCWYVRARVRRVTSTTQIGMAQLTALSASEAFQALSLTVDLTTGLAITADWSTANDANRGCYMFVVQKVAAP